MQLHLQNKDLQVLLHVLERIKVTNMAANRGRAKLLGHVGAKLSEYAQDELDLIKSFAQTGEEGDLLRTKDGNYIPRDDVDLSVANELLTELSTEEVFLDAGEYTKRYQDFLSYLSSCEDAFDAESVLVIDAILEQFEGDKDGFSI